MRLSGVLAIEWPNGRRTVPVYVRRTLLAAAEGSGPVHP